MKDKYIRIMVTPEQKDFIQKTAKKEMRTMTALIKAVFKDGINPESGEILPSVYIEEVETVSIKINE